MGLIEELYELLDNIGDGTSKHLQSFGHLKSHHCGFVLPDMVNSFVYLKGIV